MLFLLLHATGAEEAPAASSAPNVQFRQSVEACPSYRGPVAWQQFIRRISASMAQVNLLDLVAAQAEHVAVLVEPRRDPCIGLIVREVFHYLSGNSSASSSKVASTGMAVAAVAAAAAGDASSNRAAAPVPWRLHIFHGPDNLEFIKNELMAGPSSSSSAASPVTASAQGAQLPPVEPSTCAEEGSDGRSGTCRSSVDARGGAQGESILDRVTFTDLSTIVARMDAAADVMQARLDALESASKKKQHFTYDSRRGGLPSVVGERWPAFLLKQWREQRQLMDAETTTTPGVAGAAAAQEDASGSKKAEAAAGAAGLWNLNRFVYSQVGGRGGTWGR